MQYRNVGRTGLKVSSVSIGGWLTLGGSVELDGSVRILHTAVDHGVNFIDLADVYAGGRAEDAAGRFLKEYTAGDGRDRSDLVISSKVFWPMGEGPNARGLSRKHIMESVEASLRRLGTDYLDLYFCHRYDDATPLDETARAMDDLVRQGKVLYWGTSCWNGAQLRAAHRLCTDRGMYEPVVEQPQYNLLDRHIERDVLPTAAELGMGLVVWSPLAQGVLTGKYNDGKPKGSRGATTDWLTGYLEDGRIEKVRRFCEIARDHRLHPSQMALAMLLSRPEISSVITGASRPEHVLDNLPAASVKLDQGTVDEVWRLFS